MKAEYQGKEVHHCFRVGPTDVGNVDVQLKLQDGNSDYFLTAQSEGGRDIGPLNVSGLLRAAGFVLASVGTDPSLSELVEEHAVLRAFFSTVAGYARRLEVSDTARELIELVETTRGKLKP